MIIAQTITLKKKKKQYASIKKSYLTDGCVVFVSRPHQPVSCQAHGQAKITDNAGPISFHQNITTVEVTVRNRRLVMICLERDCKDVS